MGLRIPMRAAIAGGALLLTVGAAAPDIAATGAIAGRTVDIATGRGMPGARVSVNIGLESRTAVADSGGRFLLEGVPSGSGFRVIAEKPGFRTAADTVTVVSGRVAALTLALSGVYLDLLAPGGGEHLVAGTDLRIRWEAAGVGTLRIEFSPNDGRAWITLAGVDAASGSWVWAVPDIPTTNGIIRIVDPARPDLSARNGRPISISST